MDSFIQQALVFIGASVILVPLFQKLGFGSVLGYLIAGILVGPFGLKFVSDSESVMHFSELGVTLLLFVIGLEIQPRKLWSMRRHLFGLGGLQVILTSLIFMFIGQMIGFSPMAAGVVGFGLSLSSTAFAVQTLTERNQFNTEFGRSSFSILLMQDLFAIPALAVIPALGHSIGNDGMSWPKLAAALGVILALIAASRFLIRPAFRLIASTRSREVFTAAALFIVLGVAALMQKVGLSAALGTFIAGMLLADSEYRHELETNIEPFKSLLMGLFFIAVGMGVNLTLFVARPLDIVSLAIAYLFVKSLIIYCVGRLFKLNHENAKLMSLSIAQGGEFAFVIFGMAMQFALITSETLDLLIAVITLSMSMSPFLNLINDRISRLKSNRTVPAYDEIKDESPQVIIAGFGRFGQTFGRILRAQDIPFVAIDHDPDQIELVRKFGNKVYYGDASRIDLLETAGAGKAKYFILAIDDVEVSLQAAKVIREHFPNLKIFARARNRGHAFEVMDLGIQHIKREVFDSSVYFVKDLLVEMGYEASKAALIIEKFKRHDELMLNEQFKVRGDDKALISLSAQGVAQLNQVLNDDITKSYIDSPVPNSPKNEARV
jgi:monovalent cation:proton antiporter-2 (CPA2) family protein